RPGGMDEEGDAAQAQKLLGGAKAPPCSCRRQDANRARLHPDRPTGSGAEDLLEVPLDVLLGAVLRQRELLDEQGARRVQHLPLPERELLVGTQAVEIPENLGDLEDRAGLDLFHVLAVSTVPRGDVDRNLFLPEDLVDLL